MPDEFAAGYHGRLIRHNGWADAQEAQCTLRAWTADKTATQCAMSTVEVLARVAGMDVASFVCDHTLVPLARAFTSTASSVPHGGDARASLLATVGLRRFRAGAFFCLQCVEEDYALHGMPYWRRAHQLPGRYGCPRHGCALGHTSARDAYLRSPTDFMTRHDIVSESWLRTLQQSQPIDRFLAICSGLLATRHPLDERRVARTVRARAADLGLHTGRGAVRRPLLSDRIKRQFDRVWLNSVIPGLIECPDGKYWMPVDAAAFGKRAGVSAIAYALVYAALFESADAAIDAMLAQPSVAAGDSLASASTTAVDDARLRETYMATKGSYRGTAAQLHVGHGVANTRLKALGLPALGNHQATVIQNVVAEALRGEMNFGKASIAHGLAPATMQKILRAILTPLTQALDHIVPATPRSAGPPRRGRSRSPVPPPMQRAGQATAPPAAADSAIGRRRNSPQRKVRSAA